MGLKTAPLISGSVQRPVKNWNKKQFPRIFPGGVRMKKKERTRRIIAGVIAAVLVAAMIIPMVLQYLV